MQAILTVQVDFDVHATDKEALACAMDTLLETALSTPGILDEYGPVRVGPLFVQSSDATNAVPFSDKELATVLAALRQWQQHLAECEAKGESPRCDEHFAEEIPSLTTGEIDDLCERINCSDAPMCLPN